MLHDAADELIRETLTELGLDEAVYRLGLEQSVGYAGRLLFPAMKAQIALACCLIKQPQLLILNNAFGAFGADRGATDPGAHSSRDEWQDTDRGRAHYPSRRRL